MGNILGMLLKLIGGFPLKIAMRVVGDHMLLTKSTFPYIGAGSLSGIAMTLLNNVLGGLGLSAILQNPIGAAVSFLQGKINQGIASLTSIDPGPTITGGGGGDSGQPQTETPSDISVLIGRIGSVLTPALNDLHDAAMRLAGLVEPDWEQNQYGALDVTGHAALLSSGLNFGSNMDMSLVLGPLASDPQLQGFSEELEAIIAAVVTQPPTMTPNEAMDAIDVMAGHMNNIVAASNAAIEAGRSGAMTAGTASSIIADAVASNVSPQMQAYLDLVLQPSAKQAIADDKAARLAAQQQAQEDEQAQS